MSDKKPAKTPRLLAVQKGLLKVLYSGRYQIGDPLPPHTHWAREFEVSTFTVSQAFRWLLDLGVIESVKGSGTFLRKLPEKDLLDEKWGMGRKKTILNLWSIGNLNVQKMKQAVLRRQFQQDFFKKYPSIEIQERVFELGSEMVEAEMVRTLLVGKGPSIGHSKATIFPILARNNALHALTDEGLPDEMSLFLKDYFQKLDPSYLRVCSMPSLYDLSSSDTSRSMESFLLPTGVTYSFLIYSREKFKEGGIESDLHDWSEWMEVLNRLRSCVQGMPPFAINDVGILAWWLNQWVYQSMDLEKKEGTANDRSISVLPAFVWDSPEALSGIRYMLQIMDEGLFGLIEEDPHLFHFKFLTHQIPITVGTSELVSHILKNGQADSFGLLVPPVGPNGLILSQMNCGGWFVNKNIDEDQYVAAIRYLSESTKQKTSTSDFNLFSVFRDAAIQVAEKNKIPKSWIKAIEKIRSHAWLEARESDWDKINLQKALQNILGQSQKMNAEAISQYLHFRFQDHETTDSE